MTDAPQLLRVEVDWQDGDVWVSLTGELDVSTIDVVSEELDRVLAAPGLRRLVVDLRGLSFMASVGLGVLLRLTDGSRRDGYELAMVKGPPSVHRVLELTRVDERLPLIDDPEESGLSAASS